MKSIKYKIQWFDNGKDEGNLETWYNSSVPARKRVRELRKWSRSGCRSYTFELKKIVTTTVEVK